MAFLDNSGDIILDAVLTDTGRFRLAKGDGSFKIVKFAFSDDEINYGTFNSGHTSGSAYYDLEILQTPVLEAFTNNTSTMKSKLVTIPRTNLLYMPVMRVHNTANVPSDGFNSSANLGHDQLGTALKETSGTFLIATTNTTETNFDAPNTDIKVLQGATTSMQSSFIRIDQGLHTTDISQAFTLDPDLKENQYIIQMDHRLGTLLTANGSASPVSFIDDDNIATYYVSGPDYVVSGIDPAAEYWKGNGAGADKIGNTGHFAVHGPLGSILKIKIGASIELNTSNYLFETLGGNQTVSLTDDTNGSVAYKFIDSIVKVTGASTGYTLHVPIRYIKEN